MTAATQTTLTEYSYKALPPAQRACLDTLYDRSATWPAWSRRSPSFVWENPSGTEKQLQRLAKKGMVETTEVQLQYGTMTEYRVSAAARPYLDARKAERERMQAEAHRIRQAEQDARDAENAERLRQAQARAAAVERLIAEHPMTFELYVAEELAKTGTGHLGLEG